MDLSPILARLKTQLVGLKSVGAAADLDAAIEGAVAMPAAFVLPMGESAIAMDMVGRTGEQVALRFGVVHCIGNRRDAQGSASLDDLKTHRLALKAALIGWVPDPATGEPVHFSAGHLLRLDGDGRLWWIDEFQLMTYYWSP